MHKSSIGTNNADNNSTYLKQKRNINQINTKKIGNIKNHSNFTEDKNTF